MMKKVILFATALAFVLSVGSVYALQKTDVVAVWVFDEGKGKTVEDTGITQGKHNGEIVGSVEWVEGYTGKALDFTGEDGNHVVVPHKSALSLSKFTITAWVKIQPRPADRSGHWQVVMIKEGDDGERNYSLLITSPGGQPSVGFSIGGAYPALTGNALVVDGEWHHIAGTYDADEGFKLYVDGEPDSEAPTQGDLPLNTGDLLIGNNVSGLRATSGVMDEIAIFKVALTPEDVKTVFLNGLEGFTPVEPAGKLGATWGGIKSFY